MMLDPADVDWTQKDDYVVYEMAKSGISQALDEAIRRGIYDPEEAAREGTAPTRV